MTLLSISKYLYKLVKRFVDKNLSELRKNTATTFKIRAKVLRLILPKTDHSGVLVNGFLTFLTSVRDRPYTTSDGRGKGGSAKSDFISKGVLIKHLMRGEGDRKRAKII